MKQKVGQAMIKFSGGEWWHPLPLPDMLSEMAWPFEGYLAIQKIQCYVTKAV